MKAVYLKDKTGNKIVTTPYYRVGDLFLTTIATNPSSYLGGTWELFGPGRCLVCVNTSDSDFNTVKKTGGAKTKTTGNHTLTVNEMPSHTHNIYDDLNGNQSRKEVPFSSFYASTGGQNIFRPKYEGVTDQTNKILRNTYTGGGNAHNHGDLNVLQPYITCYIWIRTA